MVEYLMDKGVPIDVPVVQIRITAVQIAASKYTLIRLYY